MTRRIGVRTALVAAALGLFTAACGLPGEESGEPLEPAEARERLDELADEIGWIDAPITRSASIPPPSGADLAATLPPLDEFPLRVDSPDPGAVEIWSSTEKSGAAAPPTAG
jgi:Ca-activated chloride channel homolog